VSVGAGDGGGVPVAVQTRFDRFPATIKGALVLRGADRDPHTVRLLVAEVARVPDGPAKAIPIGDVVVDVAPARDLFLPFEAAISDLEPGWYAVRSEILVDGGPTFVNHGRPFSVPWPRSEVRTGTVQVNEIVRAGERSFRVERLELKGDRTAVVWREEPAKGSAAQAGAPRGSVHILLRAGDRPLPEVPADPSRDAAAPGAERRSTAYPVPKTVGSIRVVVKAVPGGVSDPIEVTLD
jgi:hypothetical protein